MPSSKDKQQQKDLDCAKFCRAALFPSRLHRDVTHANNFPALLVLDRYRQQLLRSSEQHMLTFSNVFPRRVVVVRNLADENDMQWNGQPDIEQQSSGDADASLEVIPNRLSVRCTSECDKLLSNNNNKLQRAFVQSKKSNNNNGEEEKEIVVCSDRVLQSDYKGPLDSTLPGKDLPKRSLAAAEEVLAHQLVTVEQQQQQQQQQASDDINTAASIQVQAARAAECYYSRHEFENQTQVKRGSQLGALGFSLLPHGMQQSMQRNCVQRVATEHLLMMGAAAAGSPPVKSSRSEAQKAVQEAMKKATS